MKNRCFYFWLLAFSFSVLFLNNACQKETDYELQTGQLKGLVVLTGGNIQNTQDYSGVEVIAEGSNPELKAYTDENGAFVFDNLKSGTYNFIFKKKGYGEFRAIGYQFIGGTINSFIGTIYLEALSDVQFSNVVIKDAESYFNVYLEINADVINPNHENIYYCRYYLSNNSDVSYNNYVSTDKTSVFYGDGKISFSMLVDTIQFPVKSKLYLILYHSYYDVHSYVDIETGRIIYPSINTERASNVASIVVPEKTTW